MDRKTRRTERVGNADLYIGMVRKRKSYARDSKGFEPIEEYFKEMKEALTQNSSDSESGEETDVEEEKRKEEQRREQERKRREIGRRKREEIKRAGEARRIEQEKEAQRKEAEERERREAEERERREAEERERRETEEREWREAEKRERREAEKRERREVQERERREAEERERREAEERERKEAARKEAAKKEASLKKRGKRWKSSVQQGSRRSLRRSGINSDNDERGSSQSTTDTESGTGSETATTHDELTRPPVEAITERPVESQSDTDGGGSEREGRKVSASRQGRKLRKSAASGKKTATEKGSEKENETGREETGREEVVGEEGSVSLDSPVSGTGDEGGEDEGGGRAGLDSAELYSPQVSGVGSPTRDTIKLGPIRLTFSASPSDEEWRKQDRSRSTLTAAVTADQRHKITRRTITLPPQTRQAMDATAATEEQSDVAEGESSTREGDVSEGEGQFKTTVMRSVLGRSSVSSHFEGSFHPKKTSTQVKGGKLGAKSTATTTVKKAPGKRAKSGIRGIRALESDSEEEEEEDRELMSLLEPGGRMSRLVGLSQLTRSRPSRAGLGEKSVALSRGTGGERGGRKARGGSENLSSQSGESTDEERLPPSRKSKSAARPKQSAVQTTEKRKQEPQLTTAKQARAVASNTTILSRTGRERKKSRKSVAFNPHTTNLGSPELEPPSLSHSSAPATAKQVERGTTDSSDSGSAVYDYVPSDEEDYTHAKSRLYSPKRKSILRKAASAKVSMVRSRQQKEETFTAAEEAATGEGGGAGASKPRTQDSLSIRDLSVRVENISSRGQWFVPDVHSVISKSSPRSLQRLTRTERAHVSEAGESSEVVVQKKRRRQRPKELDSTLLSSLRYGGEGEEGEGEGDGAAGEIDSGAQSGGASSAEEGLAQTSDSRRRVASSTEQSTSSARSSRPGKQRSRLAKLTPPWQRSTRGKKAATSKSDSELDVEEDAPAFKKQRVSTPEEDEGMQSGDGRFMSSSEEEEEKDGVDLVRSMGGRRYRRHILEHREDKTPGVRRSKRTRLAPVQYWKNEEVEYERRRSGMTLKGVLVPLERVDRRPARKRKLSPEEEATTLPLTVINRHGVREDIDIVKHSSLCDRINGQTEAASNSDELVIVKLHSSHSTSCGLIELRYLGEKEKSKTTTHEVFFFVLRGQVRFLVDRQDFDLSADSQIRIPAGVPYAVKNVHRKLARLYFHSHQVVAS